jgi:hypothetical protein
MEKGYLFNADVDLQSENDKLCDLNKNYAVKGVQKLDFHTTTEICKRQISNLPLAD